MDEVWPNDLKPIFCIAGNIGSHYVLCHYTHCELRSMSPHMHKWGRVMISLNCLYYLVTSSKQNMEGESLGDYITCGRCDVMSGRHTGGGAWRRISRPFPCPMFAGQCQYCLLFTTNQHKVYGYIIQSDYTLCMYTDLSYRSSTLSSLMAPLDYLPCPAVQYCITQQNNKFHSNILQKSVKTCRMEFCFHDMQQCSVLAIKKTYVCDFLFVSADQLVKCAKMYPVRTFQCTQYIKYMCFYMFHAWRHTWYVCG